MQSKAVQTQGEEMRGPGAVCGAGLYLPLGGLRYSLPFRPGKTFMRATQVLTLQTIQADWFMLI